MSLPKIDHPIVEIELQSLGRKLRFRPFLVKEEKLLLIAKESNDPNEIRLAITQMIQNCALDEVNVEALPLFDIEMLFLKLRAKSVGESVKLVFNCKNEIDGKVCDTDTDYNLNLENIHFEVPEGHDPKIMITDKVGIKLKYPSLDDVISFDTKTDTVDLIVNLIADNIEYIFDMESIYKPEEAPREQLIEFLSNLTTENITKIQEFFTSSPKVVLDDTVKCKKCGFEHKLHAENLLDFFV